MTTHFWCFYIGLYVVECTLKLPSPHLFLQWMQLGPVLQDVSLPLPEIGTGGRSSSRCRQAVPLVVADAALGAPIQVQSGPSLQWS